MKDFIKYHTKKNLLNFNLKNQSKIQAKFVHKSNEFENVVLQNRKTLNYWTPFFTLEEYKKNDYGIPVHIFDNINKKINNYPTYSDLIVFIMKKFFDQQISYLEIGASVLKNFIQIVENTKNNKIFAFDLNPLNDKFINLFEENSDNYYSGVYETNFVAYFEGDLLSKTETEKFKIKSNTKFNFVFSDALHTEDGVLEEYKNIIENNLSKNFVLYFDDLDFPGVEKAARNIFKDLRGNNEKLEFFTFFINGWVGENEKFHKNGFITNMNIGNKIEKYVDLYQYKKIL